MFSPKTKSNSQELGGPKKICRLRSSGSEPDIYVNQSKFFFSSSCLKFYNPFFDLQVSDDEDNPKTPTACHPPPSPFLIVANKINKGPVILNVGGKRHEVITICCHWWFLENYTVLTIKQTYVTIGFLKSLIEIFYSNRKKGYCSKRCY